MQVLSVYLLLSLIFISTFAASGIVPLFAKVLLENNLSWGFAPYFCFLLLGQFIVYKSKKLNQKNSSIKYLIPLFALSLFFVNLLLNTIDTPYTLTYLILNRAFEGLMIGMILPQVFQIVLNSEICNSLDKKLIILNIINLLGYIIGIIASEHWPITVANFLETSVLLIIFLYIALMISWPKTLISHKVHATPSSSNNAELQTKFKVINFTSWFDTFFLLFFAKVYYSLLITYLIFNNELQFYGLTIIILLLTLSNVSGQVLASYLTRILSVKSLSIYTTIFFSLSLLTILKNINLTVFLILAVTHSIIYFLGLKKIAYKPNNAKNFAFINCLSDPGLILGSALSALGHYNALLIVSFLAIIPFLKKVLQHYQYNRAEEFYPLTGFFTLLKRSIKVNNPKCFGLAKETPPLIWNYTKAPLELPNKKSSQNLKILFGGDTVFSNDQRLFQNDIKEWIASHHIRILNLEAPFFSNKEKYQPNILKKWSLQSDIPSFEKFNIYDGNLLFNTISTINNHCQDHGMVSYNQSLQYLTSVGIHVIKNTQSSISLSLNNQIFHINLLGKSFGSNNVLARKHLPNAFISPDVLEFSDYHRNKLINELKKLSLDCDYSIFSYHWGYEAENEPSGNLVELSKLIQHCGVTILYGHHSHIAQPAKISTDHKFISLFSSGNLNLNMHRSLYKNTSLFSIEIDTTTKEIISLHTKHFIPDDKNLIFFKEVIFY